MIERFRLFVGQGVNHASHGYGVIGKVGEKTAKTVKVKFSSGEQSVEIAALDHATMPEEEMEELQEKFENNGHITETRNTRTVVLVRDARDTGRMEASPMPRQNVVVPSSGLTTITTPGGKCFHGNYIPYLSDHPDMAQACSLCYPYVIAAKEDAEYLA